METSQLPRTTSEIIRDIFSNLEYAISLARAISQGQHSQGPTTLAGSTTDDNIHMQKRLKTQLNQSEHTPLSTPAVPKEKTLAQVEMKIAGSDKTDMFENVAIPTRKTKTQKQKQTKGSGRSKNLPLRRKLPATPKDLMNLTRAMSAGNQRGLRPPFPPLHSFMALPVLPDVSEESTTDDNIHMPPLPENAEKTAAIAPSDATAGAGSSSSEPSLIGMHNNSSHEDGDETLADHERRKRDAGSSAEGSEGSSMKKAKVIEELPTPVSLPTDQSERQGIGMGVDRPTSLQHEVAPLAHVSLRIPGLVPKSAGAMRSGPATQHPLEVIQTPGEAVMELAWPLQQQVSPQQLLQQQPPVASEERASHPLLMAEGDKTLVENALATLESLPGREEPVTPSADQASQMLAGQDRSTGLGGPSLAYQAATGLNADIGFTQNLMLRDELVAAAERFAKVTFETAMKASREEADKLRKEKDDAQAAASEERRLREGLVAEKLALMKVLLAKTKEAEGLEQQLEGMEEKRTQTQLRSELEALSAEHGRLKDAALFACSFAISGSSTRETPTSVIIEGLNNLPDRLATVIKNRAFNEVRDAFAVVRSRYDFTDLNKIG